MGTGEEEGHEDVLVTGCVDVPLPLMPGTVPDGTAGGGEGGEGGRGGGGGGGGGTVMLRGVLRGTGETVRVPVPIGVLAALSELGLDQGVGMLRMARLPGQSGDVSCDSRGGGGGGRRGGSDGREDAGERSGGGVGIGGRQVQNMGGVWLPLQVHQGLPLGCLPLCKVGGKSKPDRH